MAKREIVTVGSNTVKPVFTFEEASFPEYIMETIRMQGFTEPTAIQAQVCVWVCGCGCVCVTAVLLWCLS